MPDEPKKTHLSKQEQAVIRRALDMLGEHFDAGAVLVTFRKGEKTKKHREIFGNALAAQKLIDCYSAEEIEIEPATDDPLVENEDDDDDGILKL